MDHFPFVSLERAEWAGNGADGRELVVQGIEERRREDEFVVHFP